MRMRGLLLCTLAPMLAPACTDADNAARTSETASGVAAATSADVGSVREALAPMRSRWITGLQQGDTAAIAGVLTEDAIVIFPAGPTHKGRANVVNAMAEAFAASSARELKWNTEDVIVSGDLAAEIASFEYTVQPKSGNASTDLGRAIIVWRRQADGSWRVARAINKSDSAKS